MRFIIPSYGRSTKNVTVNFLLSMGVQPTQILVQTQTEDDFALYRAALESTGVPVAYTPAYNLAGNINNALSRDDMNPDDPVIIMDDDVHGLLVECPPIEPSESEEERAEYAAAHGGKYRNGHLIRSRLVRPNGFYFIIHSMAEAMSVTGATLIGIRNNHNTIGFHRLDDVDKRFSRNRLVAGTLLMGRVIDLMMDQSLDYGEDLELSLRLIKAGKVVLTDSGVAPAYTSRRAKPSTIGGREKGYDSPENQECFKTIVDRYSGMAAITKGYNVRSTVDPEYVRTPILAGANAFYALAYEDAYKLNDKDRTILGLD